MSNSSFVNQINSIRQIVPAYFLPPIFLMGIIGNTLNIIVFARSRLRANVSSWYFICLSISQIGSLFSSCLARIISSGWSYGYDIGGIFLGVCKSRAYATTLFTALSRYFLCLITIDRWMKTSRSAWLRQKSSPKYAKWFITLGVTFWTVFTIHAPIGFQTVSNICALPPGSTYTIFSSVYNIVVGIAPFLIMIIFCFLLLKTIRKRHRNVTQVPTVTLSEPNQQAQQQSRTDFQLVRLSVLQSIFYLIFNSVASGYPVYTFITSSWVKSIEQRAIDSLVSDIGAYLLNTYISVSSNLFLYLQLFNSLF
jgi:hypothetical protein